MAGVLFNLDVSCALLGAGLRRLEPLVIAQNALITPVIFRFSSAFHTMSASPALLGGNAGGERPECCQGLGVFHLVRPSLCCPQSLARCLLNITGESELNPERVSSYQVPRRVGITEPDRIVEVAHWFDYPVLLQ